MRRAMFAVLSVVVAAGAQAYQPAKCPLMTEWGERVTPENAWREYPRPQMVRGNWTNLNGEWDYAVTSVTNTPGRPEKWDGKILVPFALESALSGVGKLLEPDQFLWYSRKIQVQKRGGERILLHFGAVDFRTMVFIGHREVTDVPHEGGQNPFTLDITDYVVDGENELTVCVWDPTEGFVNSNGKQRFKPFACFYTRVSGIWQTVWMETVPEKYIRGYKITTDIDNSTVRFEFDIAGKGDVVVKVDGVSQSGESGESGEVVVKIPNAKLWSPETPHLYHFTAKYGEDEIRGYFGMRKFEKRKDANGVLRFFLNNRPYYVMATLDQGWWPDGLLTPPSEEAMAFDIRTLKDCGFNAMRKHLKVEPLRYYHLCDRMGLLVVQDLPSGNGDSRSPTQAGTVAHYGLQRQEQKELMDVLQAVPSVVMWASYNEGCCQPGEFLTHSMLDFVRRYDPTRLVNGPSGYWDWEGGHVLPKPWNFDERMETAHRPAGVCEAADAVDLHLYRGPGMHAVNDRRVSFLGEFGGLGHSVEGHLWKTTSENWGYGAAEDTKTREGLEKTYLGLMEQLEELARKGLGGSVYTQTTDVEIEINGLMTYDRKVLKFDPKVLKAAHDRVIAAGVGTAGAGETTVRGLSVGDVRIVSERPGGWTFATSTAVLEKGVEELAISLSAPAAEVPPTFTVAFDVPQLDAHHRWTSAPEQVCIPPNWACGTSSRFCSGLPLVSFLSDTDENRILVAASEAKRTVRIDAGVCEESNRLEWKLTFFGEPEAPLSDCTLRLRFDTRRNFFGDAIREGVAWIERTGGMEPAAPPPAAFDPLYSSWYSFHQDVKDAEIERECEMAAALGMKTLIVDDGWQTDDTNRGYAFAGDWEISGRRFPDMVAHVRKVHALGMKYMVWYAVPAVGFKSGNHDLFKGKYLWSDAGRWAGYSCLDPRFPEVRRHLCDLYEKAVRDWDIDGLKLDFVDAFEVRGEDPAVRENYAGRDIKAVPEAVDALLREVRDRIAAIKPDFLFEFRQGYIGPAIRQYGNMLRAADCPGDLLQNRCRTANLRLTSGGTAVHSDMLEWNREADVGTAARYVLSTMFSVIQYSVMLRACPEDHLRMIRHWIGFSQRHRETLLKGSFRPHGYGAFYPWIEAEGADERVVGVYLDGTVVPVDAAEKANYVLNGTGAGSLVVDAAEAAVAEVFDTFGEKVADVRLEKGLNRVVMPVSGYLKCSKEKPE